MEKTTPQDLKYGIIYLYCDRNFSPGVHDPEEIVRKFVHPMQVQWVDEPGRGNLLLVARRFNVGNIGKYATVSLTLSRMNRSGGWFEAIRHFADALMGISDTGDGDVVIDENDYGARYFDQSSVFGTQREAAPQDHTSVKTNASRARRSVGERLRKWITESKSSMTDEEASACSKPKSERPLLHDEEDNEVRRLERSREQALRHIKREIVNYIARYQQDPKELMAELLRGKVVVGQPGRVLVNGDLRIVLPEYDEMEILMPAMCRTLYILFMKRRWEGRGGIVLKNIGDCRDEILDIYGMVKPGANEQRVLQSVDNLCNPCSDSLHQMISRINRCVRNVITDNELVKQYIITGNKGGEYGIMLDPEHMELPRAVMA